MSVKSLKTGTRSVSMLAGNLPEHHVLIAESMVGSGGAASVTFSNIPADYQHLQIRGIVQTNRTGVVVDDAGLRINSDSGNNYSSHYLLGGFTSSQPYVASGSNTSISYIWSIQVNSAIVSSSYFAAMVLDVLDYSSTSKNKTIRCLNGFDVNGTSGSYGGTVALTSGLWMSTNAVTSLTLYPRTGTAFNQHSTFALYGVK